MDDYIKYSSTRGGDDSLSYEEVLLAGLARDGGLFMPEKWPSFSHGDLKNMKELTYSKLATKILKPFIQPFLDEDDISNICESTYSTFGNEVAPLKELKENTYILELFHGPTLAFKDYAMQFLSRAFNIALAKKNKRAVILGATSGDTGSAALEAFKGKDNIDIFILFPHKRVSEVQQKQMTWINEDGAHALSVKTDFDGCQAIVKDCFEDLNFKDRTSLSAINSINWVRLLPQIVYYFYSALRVGSPEKEVVFSVPTGNFGNILAGWMAKKMGLPISKLICGSNQNDILTRFFENGIMKRKNVFPSYSPSMDIQVSSNFERLVHFISKDSKYTRELFEKLEKNDNFEISKKYLDLMLKDFEGGCLTDRETEETLKNFHTEFQLIIDPHTAVGYAVGKKMLKDSDKRVYLSTAHYAKFIDTVSKSINEDISFPKPLSKILEKKEKFKVIENSLDELNSIVESVN